VAREWRRLLVPPARLRAAAGLLELEPAEAHYLRRVLRLQLGDRFAVIDGCGQLWSAVLQARAQARLEQDLAAPLQRQRPPSPQLELLVAPPKRDADVVLRMACELGFDRLTLVQAERRVAGPLAADRAEAIVREACEQSERLWLPELALELPLEQALGPDGPGDGPGCGSWLELLATTRHGGLPALAELLPAGGQGSSPARVRLAIGPEGGWTPAEEQLAMGRGWQRVSLGPTILRTSTAAVAGAAQLAAWRAGLQPLA
jgi:16S rRNA (uracil1498-N3)-methyltransferase